MNRHPFYPHAPIECHDRDLQTSFRFSDHTQMIRYRQSEQGQVWLFGQGLVGGAIADALGADAEQIAYDWSDDAGRADTRTRLAADLGTGTRLDLVWAAGRSGFGSSAGDMSAEAALLDELIAMATGLATAGAPVTFHLISSAGGLYEGQTGVTMATPPAPQRAYGHGKLAQETTLTTMAQTSGFRAAIYRPSSVYGYRPGGRLGLISTLITRALQGEVTHITGELDTLRDYVLADDIGRFVAGCIARNAPPAAPCLLTCGTPATISEVIAHVRSALHVPLKLEYDETPSNAAHMSFAAAAHPAGWTPTTMAAGVTSTAEAIRQDLGQ